MKNCYRIRSSRSFAAGEAPASELDDLSAIAFRWSASGQLFELLHRPALGRHFQTQFVAGLSLAVKRLGHRSRAARFAQQEDFYLEIAARIGHPQHVSNLNLARRLGGLAIGLNSAEFTGSRG